MGKQTSKQANKPKKMRERKTKRSSSFRSLLAQGLAPSLDPIAFGEIDNLFLCRVRHFLDTFDHTSVDKKTKNELYVDYLNRMIEFYRWKKETNQKKESQTNKSQNREMSRTKTTFTSTLCVQNDIVLRSNNIIIFVCTRSFDLVRGVSEPLWLILKSFRIVTRNTFATHCWLIVKMKFLV